MSHVDETSTETRGDGPDLVFVMGWGNRLDGENERWFVDRLAAGNSRDCECEGRSRSLIMVCGSV